MLRMVITHHRLKVFAGCWAAVAFETQIADNWLSQRAMSTAHVQCCSDLTRRWRKLWLIYLCSPASTKRSQVQLLCVSGVVSPCLKQKFICFSSSSTDYNVQFLCCYIWDWLIFVNNWLISVVVDWLAIWPDLSACSADLCLAWGIVWIIPD